MDWITFRAWSQILALWGLETEKMPGGLISSPIWLALFFSSCKLKCCFNNLENWIRKANDSVSPIALELVCRDSTELGQCSAMQEQGVDWS